MASRTQIRLAQLTGSFGNLAGQITDLRPAQASASSAAALTMTSGSLQGPLSEMASAIKRIHGGSQFAKAGQGQFFVDIKPASSGLDLGDDSNRFAELHLSSKLRLKGVEITDIKDEDDMVSNSDAALATQQSIKAYIDAQDHDDDLGIAGDSGTGSVDLDAQSLTITGGTALTSVASGQAVTINLDNLGSAKSVGGALKRLTATVDAQGRLSALGEAVIQNATVSDKGVASFASGDFGVSSGAVTIKGAGVDFAQIQNVAASSVMGVIGNSAAAPADIAIETTLAGNAGKLARADAIKTYSDGYLGGKAFDQSTRLAGHTIIFDATQDRWESAGIAGVGNQTSIGRSDGLVTIGLANDVTIQNDLTVDGDLIVRGDQLVANVTDLQIEDKQIELNSVASGSPISNQGAGFFISGSAPSKDIVYSALSDGGRFELNTDHGVATGKAYFVNTNNVLNQTTLGSTVLASSLTSVGALAGGSIAAAFGNIDNGASTLDSGAATLASVAVTGASVLNGAVTLGDDASDVITPNGVFAGDLVPNNGTRKLGNPAGNKWAELHVAGEAVVDDIKLDAKTISVLDAGSNASLTLAPKGTGSVVMAKVDIGGGAIDGTAIGAAAAASGAFTTLSCNDKALAAGALNINSEPSITLAAGDEFAVSDVNASNEIKKTTLGDIQTFLAANGSAKNVVLNAADVGAGTNVSSGISDFGTGAASTREVFVNGQLMYEHATGDFEASGINVDFSFDLEADDVITFIKRA